MSPSGDQHREDIWKVYIPHKLWTSPSGFLYGFLYHNKHVACVTTISNERIVEHVESNKEKLQCLGYWHAREEFLDRSENSLTTGSQQEHSASTVWMDMYVSEKNSPACSFRNLTRNKKNLFYTQVTCIVYNAAELLSSHFLCNDGIFSSISDVGLTNIEILAYFLHQYRKWDFTKMFKTGSYHGLIKHKSVPLCHKVIMVISSVIAWLYFAWEKVFDCR